MNQKLKLLLLLICLTIFFLIFYNTALFNPTDYHYLLQEEATKVDEGSEIEKLAKKWRNLPLEYWYERRTQNMWLNQSCAHFPDILNIQFIHEYWQEFETTNGTFKLFGAYLDDRNSTNTIRILSMLDIKRPKVKTFCQFWFEDSTTPIIVPVYEYLYLWHEYWGYPPNGIFKPFMVSCSLPPENSTLVPKVVSLVEQPCDRAKNSLVVNYKKPEDGQKKNFAVCIKGLNFVQDISIRLIEWIELLRLLGVDKIYFYNIIMHRNVSKLLAYYQYEDVVEINTLTLSQITLNEPYLEHLYLEHEGNLQPEVIPFNDCFLKNMYLYNYISVLDVDEVIMPKGDLYNWMDIISRTKFNAMKDGRKEPCTYVARNCYYFDNFTIENMKDLLSPEDYDEQLMLLQQEPKFLHMLRHVYRSLNCSQPGYYVKSIHDTRKVLAVHNHMPLATLEGDNNYVDIDLDDGHMHHYRATCPLELSDVCYEDYMKDFIFDDTIFKYKDELKDNIMNVLDILGYL